MLLYQLFTEIDANTQTKQIAAKAKKRSRVEIKGNSIERMTVKKHMVKSSKNDGEISSESFFEMESHISGSIYFGTWYEEGEGILWVQIAKAEGLACTDASSINPYIKVFLSTGKKKQNKRKTGIQHRTNNPQYNEIVKVRKQYAPLGSKDNEWTRGLLTPSLFM